MSFYNNLATNPILSNPAIQKIWDEVKFESSEMRQWSLFPRFDYKVLDIDNDQMSSLSGFGAGQLTVEGAAFKEQRRYDNYVKDLLLNYYTIRYNITPQLMYQFDMKQDKAILQIGNRLRGMKEGLDLNTEIDFAKMHYLGHGTTFITGADGRPLYDTAHPSPNPSVGNQSNIVTVGAVTNPVLSADSLLRAAIQMDEYLNNDGVKVAPSNKKILVTSRSNYERALRIKKSEYGPDNANLGLSVVGPTTVATAGYEFEVKFLQQIPAAYADYWFLHDPNKMKEQVVRAYAWDPILQPAIPAVNGGYANLGSTLFGWNPTDWRWTIGSTGVNPLP